MADLTRRAFVAGAALGLGVATTGCGGGDPRPDFGWLTPWMSIQTWTLRGFPLTDALDQVVALGLVRVELGSNHVSSTSAPADVDAALAELAARGLTCVTCGLEETSADAAADRRAFDFARRLGAHAILVDPPADAFAALEPLVVEYDVRLGIHNHGPGSRYPLIADVLAALAGRDPRIGAILDTGHCLRSGEDPVDAVRRLAGRLHGVHLKDVAAPEAAAPDVILGDGALDLPGVLAALRTAGLPAGAAVSLEYEANPEAPFDDIALALSRIAALAR
jgi:inosose dehydratase